MATVKMEFELEELQNKTLLIRSYDVVIEARLTDFRKGLVKIVPTEDDASYWVEEDKVEVVDILFR